MKVYVANRMTGVPQFNYPWFYEAAEHLRGLGHYVQSPAEMDTPEVREAALASPDGLLDAENKVGGRSWAEILADDVKLIGGGGIDAVVVGPEWFVSKGARLETFVAYLSGIPVLRYEDLEPVDKASLVAAWAGHVQPDDLREWWKIEPPRTLVAA